MQQDIESKHQFLHCTPAKANVIFIFLNVVLKQRRNTACHQCLSSFAEFQFYGWKPKQGHCYFCACDCKKSDRFSYTTPSWDQGFISLQYLHQGTLIKAVLLLFGWLLCGLDFFTTTTISLILDKWLIISLRKIFFALIIESFWKLSRGNHSFLGYKEEEEEVISRWRSQQCGHPHCLFIADISVNYNLDPVRQLTPWELVSLDYEGHVNLFMSGSALSMMFFCVISYRES